MTTQGYIAQAVLPAALALLPAEMASPAANAMLLAIGLQESRFKDRRQLGGPARGFWQFELSGGVTGVLTHPLTRGHLIEAMTILRYEDVIGSPEGLYKAIEHNDVLAAVCARLLLWTVPADLPRRNESAAGYLQYLQGWRPGKPHPMTWGPNFQAAWELVEPST